MESLILGRTTLQTYYTLVWLVWSVLKDAVHIKPKDNKKTGHIMKAVSGGGQGGGEWGNTKTRGNV